MKHTKFLETLLGGYDDSYFAKSSEESKNLFNVFYDIKLIRTLYNQENNADNDHKLTFNLLYNRPNRIKFQNIVFTDKKTAYMIMGRNHFGPALDDFVEFGVEFNDFEIINFKHLCPIVKQKIEENYIKHMVNKFGETYINIGNRYYEDKMPAKRTAFEQITTSQLGKQKTLQK